MKSNNNESQCYFVQLQFDSYLDGELSESQQESFLQHVNSRADCAAEFHYAQTIQDGLLDLPLLDCSEQALMPARDLANRAAEADRMPNIIQQFIADTVNWLGSAPATLRYAVPILLLATVGLITLPQLSPERQGMEGNIPVASVQPVEPEGIMTTPVEYSPEDVAQALQDLSLAIEYLNQVSERTENMVGGRFLITPLRDRLNASFERVRTNTGSEFEGEEI